MNECLRVSPISAVRGSVSLPGSKSISNRALLLSALSDGVTEVRNLLVAEDTEMMLGALRGLGVGFEQNEDGTIVKVTGCGGAFPVKKADLFLGNAGTAMRPLASSLAFSGGEYTLDGVARMRERPIAHLVEALNALGAKISYLNEAGFPPIKIEPAFHIRGNLAHIRGDVSSQFLSGLLMAAPLLAPEEGLRIRVDGELISSPYVSLTCRLMEKFGVTVKTTEKDFLVPRARYKSPGVFEVEADASSASYFLALGALVGPLKVEGVGQDSVQGDAAFVEYLAKMGASVTRGENWIKTAPNPYAKKLRGIDADVRTIPDAAMTLAAIAPMCDGETTLRGIGSWRVKETDRIAAMEKELSKVGCKVESGEDWIRITPPEKLQSATFDTYKDHRMAMCMSLIAAGGVPVFINDPKCVAKTFPDYFTRLSTVVEN